MKVDLLRQLDAWGDRIEGSLDHVAAAEVIERAEEESAIEAEEETILLRDRPSWRAPLRYAGAIAVVIALIAAVPNLLGREVSREFASVGRSLGGDSEQLVALTTAAPATTAAPDTTAAAGTTAAPTTTAGPTDSTIPPAGGNPADLGRAVIFVGDLAIETTDVSAAVAQARAIVEARGGYVFAQELGGQSTVVSLKVPAAFFQDAVDRLSELGTVRSARVTSQDVTERIVDLESQIVTSETSVARLQQLLSEADSINTVTKLEAELLERETALERLRGQLRTMQDQVALSTIVVTIRQFVEQPALDVRVTARPTDGGIGDDCFTEAKTRIPENSEYVLCVDITNTGNLRLTDLDIRGPVALLADLRPVGGSTVTELAPGARYTLWTTATAIEDLREEITIKAVPLSEEGQPLVEKTTQDSAQLRINVEFEPEPQPEPELEDDGLPPLRDALSNGWNVLTTGLNALAVAGAFVLPFVWLPLLLLLGTWWWRRRSV